MVIASPGKKEVSCDGEKGERGCCPVHAQTLESLASSEPDWLFPTDVRSEAIEKTIVLAQFYFVSSICFTLGLSVIDVSLRSLWFVLALRSSLQQIGLGSPALVGVPFRYLP